jgi:hypothetical protein
MLPYFAGNELNKEELPPEAPSPFVVYTWDTDALDMPKVNRRLI